MKLNLQEYIPNTTEITKKISKSHTLFATLISLPHIGKVWYLNNRAIASSLNGYQYAIKSKDSYILAEIYPQNSYLIIEHKTSSFIVAKSIFLTNKNDKIIARRKSIGNVPIWEILDNSYIQKNIDIQNALFFEKKFFAESFKENTYIVRHKTLKTYSTVNKNLQTTTQSTAPLINKPKVLKYTPTNAVTLFNTYFSIDSKALNFINVTDIEKYKMANTNFNEISTIGLMLKSLKNDGFNLDREIAIVTPFKEQKYILIDFFANKLDHLSNNPKIGLPKEMVNKKFSVIIFSLTISSKTQKYNIIEANEHLIRKIIDNCTDGMLFVGNATILETIHGFPKDLVGLIRALRNISTPTSWANPQTQADDLIQLWSEPIKKMNQKKALNKNLQTFWEKLHKNIKYEFERKNLLGMISIYKEYLRSIGVGQKQ